MGDAGKAKEESAIAASSAIIQEERKAENERYTKALEWWKQECKAWDKRVSMQREQYHKAVKEWEEKRRVAQSEGRRIGRSGREDEDQVE